MSHPTQPSTSAALARVDDRLPQRALKTSLDDLDDDDLVELGRAVSSVSPRRALSAVGAVAAVVTAPVMAWASFPAAIALVVAGGALVIVRGKADAEADLKDAGFSAALAAELGRAAAWVSLAPGNDRFVMRFKPNRSDYLERGRRAVARVRGVRKAALTASSATAIASTDERAD